MANIVSTIDRKVRKAVRYAPVAAGRALLVRSFQHPNWGDALGPELAREISGLKIVNIRDVPNPLRRPVYSITGSIMGWGLNGNPADHVIWGAGFMHADESISRKPGRICAVRGPMTAAKLRQLGIDCPRIYGDPALLYPRFYNPPAVTRYEVGIVPHFLDHESPWIRDMQARKDCTIIDVTSGIHEFVDQLVRCRSIASSSLHGLIAADAYGVPSVWIELSDQVSGKGFKFHDYLASVHKPRSGPVVVGRSTTIGEVLDHLDFNGIDIDLDQLFAACPLPMNGLI